MSCLLAKLCLNVWDFNCIFEYYSRCFNSLLQYIIGYCCFLFVTIYLIVVVKHYGVYFLKATLKVCLVLIDLLLLVLSTRNGYADIIMKKYNVFKFLKHFYEKCAWLESFAFSIGDAVGDKCKYTVWWRNNNVCPTCYPPEIFIEEICMTLTMTMGHGVIWIHKSKTHIRTLFDGSNNVCPIRDHF